MSKRNYTIIASVAIILLVLGAVFFFSGQTSGKNVGQAALVSNAKVEMSRVNETPILGGKLEAIESANVISKITGKIKAVNVDIGSQVKAGDILITLDANEQEAGVAQAEAAVEVARSALQTARLDYETTKSNYERNKTLLEQGAISPSTFDNTYALAFKKAEQYLNFGAPAGLSQALAALQLAQANYANSIISSPINGVITAKNINPGELATTSVTLVSLVNLDEVMLQTAVDESYINQLREGNQVQVKVGAVSDQSFPGVIANIAQAASSSSKGFTVKILVDNPDHLLKPGMFAEANPSTIDRAKLVVPKAAVISEGGKDYVWIIENGSVSKKEVTKGIAGATKTEIKAGLSEGQEVVTSGMEKLQEGMKVTVQQ